MSKLKWISEGSCKASSFFFLQSSCNDCSTDCEVDCEACSFCSPFASAVESRCDSVHCWSR